MQNRIQQLPAYLANQIAAGEVVERPSSVLKELLENCLDAKASQLDITIERGGIGLIRITDNGSGIFKEDLSLAVTSHATSKITKAQDLEGIVSLGFRGEALASISAISRLTVISKPATQETAWQLYATSRGPSPLLTPAAHQDGTTLEIRDLFYNTPARRKFLKSEKTEFTYLEEVFKRIALSHFEVGFRFTHADKLLYQLTPCESKNDQLRRVAKLTNKEFIEEALELECETNGLCLKGWIGGPDYFKSSAELQYFYVNGRIIKDRLISHAIRQAYEGLCPPGRYPAYILYLEIDPNSVDVNVHPTKHEVRFREARTVHAFMSHNLQSILQQTEHPAKDLTPASHDTLLATQASPLEATPGPIEPRVLAEFKRIPESEDSPLEAQKSFQIGNPARVSTQEALRSNRLVRPEKTYLTEPFDPMSKIACPPSVSSVNFNERPQAYPSYGQFKVLLEPFIIVEFEPGGWGIIDSRLAQRLMAEIELRHDEPSGQLLVIPQIIALGQKGTALNLEPWCFRFKNLGLEIDQIGPGVLRILRLPAWLQPLYAQQFLLKLFERMKEPDEAHLIAVILDCLNFEGVKTKLDAETLLTNLSKAQGALEPKSFLKKINRDDLKLLMTHA